MSGLMRLVGRLGSRIQPRDCKGSTRHEEACTQQATSHLRVCTLLMRSISALIKKPLERERGESDDALLRSAYIGHRQHEGGRRSSESQMFSCANVEPYQLVASRVIQRVCACTLSPPQGRGIWTFPWLTAPSHEWWV